jgi:cysteine desulfurase / selenocysteine lyase
VTGGPPLDPRQFPLRHRYTYLDHAAIAPLPVDVAEAMKREVERVAESGVLAFRRAPERAERVRAAAAELMGVSADEVAFTKNTTEGLAFVANGLDWSPGDRVVVPDLEFPSVLYPWLALEDRGVRVDRVQPVGPGRSLPIGAFAEVIAAGRRPRVVCTSWVQFGRGWRTDLAALAELCHDAGALLCVDAIQGLGAIPAAFDAWGVDVASAGTHKWLLGPNGLGVVYVRRSRQDELRVLEPGWSSVPHRMEWDNLDFELDPTARRFEGGGTSAVNLAGLGAALDLLLAAGPRHVWAHLQGLIDELVGRLAQRGIDCLSALLEGRSGIITLAVGPDPERVAEELLERGIVASARGGGLRLSPHAYLDEDDVATVAAAIGEVAHR